MTHHIDKWVLNNIDVTKMSAERIIQNVNYLIPDIQFLWREEVY